MAATATPYTTFQKITVSTASIPITTIPAHVTHGWIQVQAQPIRYRLDAGTATASVGVNAVALEKIPLNTPQDVHGFRAIREGGSDAVLNVHLFGVTP